MTLVKDIMNTDVVSIDAECAVIEAASMMREKCVSCCVVTREGKPSGIITEQDIVWRVVCENRSPEEVLVGDVMSKPLIAVNPLMTLEETAEIFNRAGIKKLGVVSGEKLEGIVTATDILYAETRKMKMLERYVDIVSAGK